MAGSSAGASPTSGARPTAYSYDPFNLRHHQAGHPENRERLRGTWDLLQGDGILQDMIPATSTLATDEQLRRVHTSKHLNLVAHAAQRGLHLDADTYVGPDSEQAARLAAGGLCSVADLVVRGEAANGFALVRPPGHHATPTRGMGFCLFNNVAVAARAAQAEHGLRRVLIVDFDVHHGNGTQDVFYQDGSVLVFNTHQYPYYPGTGHWRETGQGPGQGATINVPFPAGVGDQGYVLACDQVLLPAARRFRPDLILVSAGYDAHWNDPLAGMQLSIAGYAALVQRLVAMAGELCAGRLVFTLEGGYDLQVLAHAVLTTMRLLAGSTVGVSDPMGPCPWPERGAEQVLEEVRRVHRLA
jgi:acetoin utilization deacetylase AcuC-like enzyme